MIDRNNLPFGCHLVRDGGRRFFTCRCDESALVLPAPFPRCNHCALCGIAASANPLKPYPGWDSPAGPEWRPA